MSPAASSLNKKQAISKRPRGDRNSDASIEVRRQKVVDMLLDGHERPAIVATCGKEYGISPRTVDEDIAEARKRIAASFNPEEISFAAGISIRRFNHCYQKALAECDTRTAIMAQAQLVKLYGLEQNRLHVTSEVKLDPLDELIKQIRSRNAIKLPER